MSSKYKRMVMLLMFMALIVSLCRIGLEVGLESVHEGIDLWKDKNGRHFLAENGFKIEPNTTHKPMKFSTENTKRLQKLNETCKKLNMDRSTNLNDILTKPVPGIFYSDKYKLLFCTVAKCGCSSIKEWLLRLENIYIPGQSVHTLAGKHLHIQEVTNLTELATKFDTYFKIIMVREPFHRILSAYREKLETMENREFKRWSKSIHEKYKTDNASEKINLSEFISFLLDIKDQRSTNVHWMDYLTACRTCQINWDYIAKLETATVDMEYVSNSLNISIPFPMKNKLPQTTDWSKVSSYYAKVPPTKTNQLYHKLKTDYELFDYDPPPQF